jgi:hypothetical protein
VAAAVIGLGVWVQYQAVDVPANGQHTTSYQITAALVGLARLGCTRRWSIGKRGRRRRGLLLVGAGITLGTILGAAALVVTLPVPGAVLPSSVEPVVANLAAPLAIAACLLAGLLSARACVDRASGYEAGVWAGRIGGSSRRRWTWA